MTASWPASTGRKRAGLPLPLRRLRLPAAPGHGGRGAGGVDRHQLASRVLGDAALLVPVGDPDALAEASSRRWATRRSRPPWSPGATRGRPTSAGTAARRDGGPVPHRLGGRMSEKSPDWRSCSPSSSCAARPGASGPTPGVSWPAWRSSPHRARPRDPPAGEQDDQAPTGQPAAKDPLDAFGRPLWTSRLSRRLLTRAWTGGS